MKLTPMMYALDPVISRDISDLDSPKKEVPEF